MKPSDHGADDTTDRNDGEKGYRASTSKNTSISCGNSDSKKATEAVHRESFASIQRQGSLERQISTTLVNVTHKNALAYLPSEHECLNEPPVNRLVQNVRNMDLESQGTASQLRRFSVIRPPNTPGLRQSIGFSLTATAWTLYQSMILVFLPVLFMLLVLSPPWLFDVDNRFMLVYYACVNDFFAIPQYATVYGIFSLTFGAEKLTDSLYKVTVPCYFLHATAYTLRVCLKMFPLSILYYVIFVSHYYLLSRRVTRTRDDANMRQFNTHSDILASDGTPMAVLKGFVSFIIIYYLATNYLVRYFLESEFSLRLIGRIIVIPLLFNISDIIQTNLIVYKSVEHSKYRCVQSNILCTVVMAILRLMITDSRSTNELITMSLLASASEIFFRSTYIIRMLYGSKLLLLSKTRLRKAISSLSGANVSRFQETEPPGIGQGHDIEFSLVGFRTLLSRLNENDEVAYFVLGYRRHRLYYLSLCELQLTVCLPFILYLFKPTSEYVSFQTITSFNDALLSISIQLPIELATQFISTILESYVYGIEAQYDKGWGHNISLKYQLRNLCVALAILDLVMAPYRLDPEKWDWS